MKNVALLYNPYKPEVEKYIERVQSLLEKAGLDTVVPQVDSASIEGVDLVIVLGGDGTLLYHARQEQWHGIPVLGINLGRLGFLTEVEVEALAPALQRVISGQFRIEERMMLEIAVVRERQEIARTVALNEAVVAKGALARMIRLHTFVGNRYLETYPADGIIVATPSGSTAYSLSAGGPVVHPELELMIITPIAAHALFAKPTILPLAECVSIVPAAGHDDLYLTVDGQENVALQSADIVKINQHEHKLRLVRLWQRSFYEVLRKKLRRTYL